MIYLNLFLYFLEVGAFSFGGGMSMISLIQDIVIGNGWLTEVELLRMIAIAESTPGPIAVNIATAIGASQGGILGAILATLGVVLPSFVIILIIAALLNNLLKYQAVRVVMESIRPTVVGLIFGVFVTLGALTLFGTKNIYTPIRIDYLGIALFALLFLVSLLYKKITKKEPSSILIILFSALVGMIIY
ncbi:MAG: chromate transporter [Clostridia bacterium]|nr:chromate transporter [Clostridia bacterium]